MAEVEALAPAAIEHYLASRPRRVRWAERLRGRQYRALRFPDRPTPVLVVAHNALGPFGDAPVARQIALAIEQDWLTAPESCRQSYDAVLFAAPELIVVQLRHDNLCGCLGHRHLAVREPPFAELHEPFQGAKVGEMDIAHRRIDRWQAMPLADLALDSRFLQGTRLDEFHAKQFRLKLLSVILHEIHHLVSPQEPESTIRQRSLTLYRDALASYVEDALNTLSLTIDRSFSRFE
jgi:hypothetical protein